MGEGMIFCKFEETYAILGVKSQFYWSGIVG